MEDKDSLLEQFDKGESITDYMDLSSVKLVKPEFTIKDSGKRQEFDTGAVRDTAENKPEFSLISPFALERIASHMTKGKNKYSRHNWVKGIPISRCYDSLLRHSIAFGKGDISEDHLAALCFNAMAIMHYQETNRKDMDDMFDWGKKEN